MSVIHFDPRTKIMLLFLCVLCTMFAPSLNYELYLVILVAVFGFLLKKYRYVLLGLLTYIAIYLVTRLSITNGAGVGQAVLLAFFGLVNKVYPCGFMAGIMISTTKTGEFMAALYRIHMPDSFVIPFAVMLRYLPAVKEDWRYIRDAMRMRDISPSLKGILKNPVITAECVYVPLMMAASNTADELSIAAVTRGIENPIPRTCLTMIRFSGQDALVICFFLIYFILGLLWKGGLL